MESERHNTSWPAWDAWESVFSHSVRPGDSSSKTYLGKKAPKVCRFCGRQESNANFRNESHVIPAALGNRSLFSYEECDDCNHGVGSPLESDLATFLSLPRAVSSFPARSGTPKMRHPNQKSYVKFRREENQLHICQPVENEAVRYEDNEMGTYRLMYDTPPFRFINVARALGRMLLFGLDWHEPGFDRLRSWVLGEVEWFPISIALLYFPGPRLNCLRLMAHRSTQFRDRRILCVRFLFSSLLITMPVPMDQWSLPAELALLRYPPPLANALLSNTSVFVVNDNEPCKTGKWEFKINYTDRHEV